MNEPFIMLWAGIVITLLIRFYLWYQIKSTLKKGDEGYEVFSTININILIGIIPKIPGFEGRNKIFRNIFNKLTIVLYVSLFANFILLMAEDLK